MIRVKTTLEQRVAYWNCIELLETRTAKSLSTGSHVHTFLRKDVISSDLRYAHGVIKGMLVKCSPEGILLDLYLPGSITTPASTGCFYSPMGKEGATVISVPSTRVLNECRTEPDLYYVMLQDLAARSDLSINRLSTLMSSTRRVALINTLLDLGYTGEVHATHEELAKFIGARRETITLELGKLKSEGRVVLSHKLVTIPDKLKLFRGIGEK